MTTQHAKEFIPFHPEYAEALRHQGLEATPELLIQAKAFRLAKD
jgi:hypothetical protein